MSVKEHHHTDSKCNEICLKVNSDTYTDVHGLGLSVELDQPGLTGAQLLDHLETSLALHRLPNLEKSNLKVKQEIKSVKVQ